MATLKPSILHKLQDARAELGTRTLAEELSIPAPSLRRILSTGNAGRLVTRIENFLEAQESPHEAQEPPHIEPSRGGIEVDEDELQELADLWGVSENEVEDLLEALDQDFELMTLPEIREYIDALGDALEDQGWDGDISDLWDLYYGYVPGTR